MTVTETCSRPAGPDPADASLAFTREVLAEAGMFPPAGPALVSRSAVLPGTAESAAAARRLAAEALAVTGGCPAAGDAVLLVSELVGNAVVHTRSGRGGELRVTVAAVPGEWVLVLVGDDGPAAPGGVPVVPDQRPAAGAESGRGLLIVAALAEACGYADGVSWARLAWDGAR